MPVGITLIALTGTYTATLDQRSFVADELSTVSLTPGTHTIAGTFRGSALYVVFAATHSASGVVFGSIKSLSGPYLDRVDCTVVYQNNAPATTVPFSVQFQVTSGTVGTC